MTKQYEVKAFTNDLSHEQWLESRREGIGGSDAAVVLGLSKWNTPLALWGEKTGAIESEFQGNEATEWGNRLERSVAEAFAERERAAVVAYPVILQSIERPFQLANVDFFIMSSDDDFGDYPIGQVTDIDPKNVKDFNPVAILEVKTNGLVGRASREWDNDGVPTSYFWQGAHYCAVTGLRTVIFAALIGGQGLQTRVRNYDEATLNRLNDAESKFWFDVENDIKPEPIGLQSDFDAIKEFYPEVIPERQIEVGEFEVELVEEYVKAKAAADEADTRLKKIRAQLELIVADAEAVTYEGNTLYTFKATKDSETFDTKAFKEAHPELVAQFMKPRAGFRVLRLKNAE